MKFPQKIGSSGGSDRSPSWNCRKVKRFLVRNAIQLKHWINTIYNSQRCYLIILLDTVNSIKEESLSLYFASELTFWDLLKSFSTDPVKIALY